LVELIVARYFFHVDNGTGYAEDTEGRELPDLVSAIKEAARTAADILGEDLASGSERVSLSLYVEDEAGRRVIAIPISAAIERSADS
jgi:hypothetical protein